MLIPSRPIHVVANSRISFIFVLNNISLYFVVVVRSLSCAWLCHPMDCNTPGFSVLHHLLKLAQTHFLYMYVRIYICMYVYMCMCDISFVWGIHKISMYVTHFYLSIHLSGDTDCFRILTVVNNAAKNMKVQISFSESDFVSFRWVPHGEAAGLYGNSMFGFLKDLCTVFHTDCSNLHSH